MFSLSTAWNSELHTNGIDMVNQIKAIGFDTIELNFSLTKSMVDEVLALVKKGAIKVSSLHNICPLPDEIERAKASPDYYSLSSCSEDVRRHAVEVTKNTILYASKLNAEAVVLHAGRIEIKDRTRELSAAVNEKARFEALRKKVMEERTAKKKDYFDSVIKSLGELVPYARSLGIAIGIENRYYYREIPILEELEEIFRIFPVGELSYWHDVGHAEVFDRLGLVRHMDLLERFSHRLKGIHLHDIIGTIEDHKAPGSGTFDFRRIKPYVNKETLKVLEPHQPATADEIRRSVKYLGEIF